MTRQVAYLQAPVFSTADVALLEAARVFLALSHRPDAPVALEIDAHTADATDDHAAALGEFATYCLGECSSEDQRALLTVQLTRESGRRFVLLDAKGLPMGSGNDLGRLLYPAIRPTRRRDGR